MEIEVLDFYEKLLSSIENSTVDKKRLITEYETNVGFSSYQLCKKIVSQANKQTDIKLNARILILSDRLIGLSLGLQYYLQMCAGAKVLGIASSIVEAKMIINDSDIDFLIIAGYLNNEKTYDLLSELNKKPVPPVPVFWASLDMLIHSLCLKYKINDAFHRMKPMPEFILFLQSIHKKGS